MGKVSNTGPTHNKTIKRMLLETIEAIWVTPPTVCWIIDLDSDAVIGIQEKKEPTVLLRP